MAEYDSVGGGAEGAASGAMSGAMAGAAFGPIGIGVGALFGGLFGSKKTKVPKPPSYGELMNNNLSGQEGIQQRLLDDESKWRPKYQTLQEQTLARQLYGGDGTYGYIDQLNRANTALQGVQANAAQGYMGTMASLTPQARSMLLSPQAAAMQSSIMNQAQTGLNAGTSLTAEDTRIADQTAARAMAARGLSGRQGIAASVLSNYGLGLQRQDRARQFAGTAMSQDQALQSAAMQMAGGAMGQYNAGGGFMAQANTMLGQYQPQIFQPESQMGTQAQGMQYNQQMGVARMNQQSQANLLSTMGSFGSFAASNPNAFKGFGDIFGSGTVMNIGGQNLKVNSNGTLGNGLFTPDQFVM